MGWGPHGVVVPGAWCGTAGSLAHDLGECGKCSLRGGWDDSQPWEGISVLLPWPPDCYSETEAEDPDDEAPRHGSDSVSGPGGHPGDRGTEFLVSPPAPFLPQPKKRLQNTPEKAQLSPASSAASSPQGSPRPCSPMGRWWGRGHLAPCHLVSLSFACGCAGG